MLAELPNRLFANGRSVLARFGYRHLAVGETREDWAAMWDLLKGDFARPGGPPVADFRDFGQSARSAVETYLRRRLEADHQLEICERLHVEIFAHGITPERVETYSAAFHAYEDIVDAFGAARDRVAAMLARP